jgi:phosphopantothenate-cysteine ligase/phosphopantothenoylcysteine decarboxylase/phosphopantothenate--cysteine ligase
MRILVTAGNTQTPIDAVRCITNIFTGKTGTQIALEAHQRGHEVVLLTSHPEVVEELRGTTSDHPANWTVRAYRTFDDLRTLMTDELALGKAARYQAIVHSAAISDYEVKAICTPIPTTGQEGRPWPSSRPPLESFFQDVRAGKVKSSYEELWLQLVPTPKLVDFIRTPWLFRGVLVKFKLEVGITDDELLRIAERSRQQSGADLMVANTFEGRSAFAYLGPLLGQYERISRRRLASRILDEVERLAADRKGE